ncbi:alpha/beta hydrolase [Thalassotalea sp. HSM 43]|uniref:alpha/beta hydrolase family protein n=1 Tax=Thalassotalea sp. HSM 43 TaxID=2552945 RepID=UPI0010814913|nr:alpha/beta hydrolase [Thalassotalea sp. HSM 43]QBY04200.1 alpha/beta hydrolase [Thalassotalea sp. HSM 43]
MLAASGCKPNIETNTATSEGQDTSLSSLSELTIPALQKRRFTSALHIEQLVSTGQTKNQYTEHYNIAQAPYSTYMASYDSDGLQLYTRIDIPESAPPANGYKVIIFVHGWIGVKNAPSYNFNYAPDNNYAEIIDQYVKQGFIVLTPGLRGHGAVNGKQADGIEFMHAWDNASYISPAFYAIDVLNLLVATPSLQNIDWQAFNQQQRAIRINQDAINITGHSQGGDVVLTALAVSGENPHLQPTFNSAAIWAGCILPKLEQTLLYTPMAESAQAFLSGDGTWTASAVGQDQSTNPDFLFAYPPDWITYPDNSNNDWTWQHDKWSTKTVKQSLQKRVSSMYDILTAQVEDISDIKFTISTNADGKTIVNHDPLIIDTYRTLSPFYFPEAIKEPLFLHHSDRDYYSPSLWNEKLVNAISNANGYAKSFEYKGTTHSLKLSEHAWFSPASSNEGVTEMIEHNTKLFNRAHKR